MACRNSGAVLRDPGRQGTLTASWAKTAAQSSRAVEQEEAHRPVGDQRCKLIGGQDGIATGKSTQCHHTLIGCHDDGICLHGTGHGDKILRVALVRFEVVHQCSIDTVIPTWSTVGKLLIDEGTDIRLECHWQIAGLDRLLAGLSRRFLLWEWLTRPLV